jgi:hypothetical protein
MRYVFLFDSDGCDGPSYEELNGIWITEYHFWYNRGCFSDQERGKNFPKEFKEILGNEMEAYFTWDEEEINKEQLKELFAKHNWLELPKGYDTWSHGYPSMKNILPEFKEFVKETSIELEKDGILVTIPGGLPCPWCKFPCKEIDKTKIAVCERNPKHKVKWLPRGG